MKSKSVLIVEDNDLNRVLYENLIGQLCSYESTRSGLQAVHLSQIKAFDLILMDIQLPEMNGIQAMKEIRKGAHPDIPILAITAFSQESDRQYFLDHGFDDYIVKPIRPREFLQQIENLLKKSIKNGPVTHSYKEKKTILDRNILGELLKYNSQEAMHKVLQDFLLECEETTKIIQQFESDHELDPILEKIHTLKGNSGTLGAEMIFFSAQKAEHFARIQNLPELKNELRSLKNEIVQFRDFLNQQTIFDS